ncbi:MAG: hypothetical protein RSD51_03355 [Malacoplasma sp.]
MNTNITVINALKENTRFANKHIAELNATISKLKVEYADLLNRHTQTIREYNLKIIEIENLKTILELNKEINYYD